MGKGIKMTTYMIAGLLFVFCGYVLYNYVRKLRRGDSCCTEGEAPIKKVRVADRNKANYPYQVTLRIEGMTCANCALRVENGLNSLPGAYAQVDLGQHLAKVLCKEAPDITALKQAVRDAGYIVVEARDIGM
ncbi:copper chaperone [Lachnospiraceae bacterium PF1-21]